MARFFSFDSKTAQFFSRIWDMLLLNLLFILGSLPILTMGASMIAAFSVMLKMVEDREGGIVSAYFRAFKENLRQGVLLTVLLAVAAVAVAGEFILFELVEGNPIIFLFLGILSAALVIVHFFYVFALSARYRNNLFRHMTNSRSIFSRFYLRSLLCAALVAFEVWLFFLNSWLLLFVGVFIAPVLIIGTISAFAVRFFRTLDEENGITADNYTGDLQKETTASREKIFLDEVIDKQTKQ